MNVKQLDHLNLSVQNFDETVGWYHRVFGFDLVEEDHLEDGTRWGVIKSGDAMLCIYEHADWQMVPAAQRKATGTHGLSHFALRIEDRASWLETVEKEQLAINYGGRVDWPHSKSWYVNDPTGYEIEVALWEAGTPTFG